MPALANAIGNQPGWLAGSPVDLPGGVVAEWSRWCRDPRFIAGDATLASLQNFDRFKGVVRLPRILDDPWSSDAGVADIAALYTAARGVSIWTVSADARQGGPVGHIGFFRSRHRDRLWQDAGHWLMLGGVN
jgi:predicted alpha/beta hydrolase